MKNETVLAAIYHRHCKMVWNLCYTMLQNPADAEDAMQEVFIRVGLANRVFRDLDHEKAWIITVTKNVCRDELKRARRKTLSLDEVPVNTATPPPEIDEVLIAVRALPEQYRTAIYLYYYEGCTSARIAKLTGKPDATIRTYLRRGRILLKERLEENT